MGNQSELLKKVARGAVYAFIGVAILIAAACWITNPSAFVSPSSSGGPRVVESEGKVVSIDNHYMMIAVDGNKGDLITLSLDLSRGWPRVRNGAKFEDFKVGSYVYFSYFIDQDSSEPYAAYDLGFEP